MTWVSPLSPLLAIPQEAGIVFGPIFLLVVSVIALVTICWMLEALARGVFFISKKRPFRHAMRAFAMPLHVFAADVGGRPSLAQATR